MVVLFTALILPEIVTSDQCYSYAGGSVYPQETAKGHTLQWTKAMSKLITIIQYLLLLVSISYIKYLTFFETLIGCFQFPNRLQTLKPLQ